MLGHNLKTTPRYEIDPETGCWNTLGGKTKAGYGKITEGRKTILLHRWMYELTKGAIPSGQQIHHRCHNKSCCNPDHLEAVGRVEHRRLDHQYKLTEQDVRDIRMLGTFDIPKTEIARRFNISPRHVRNILQGARRVHEPEN